MSVKGRCAMIATPLAGLPFGSPFEGATRRSLVGARTGWPENDARSSDGRSPLSAKADEREPVNTREPRLVYEAWGFLVKGTTREVRPTSPPRLFTVTHPTHRARSPTTTPRLGHRAPFPNAGGHERLGALCFNKRAKVAKTTRFPPRIESRNGEQARQFSTVFTHADLSTFRSREPRTFLLLRGS